MTQTTTLITGGAGYIGSHVARQLGEAGEEIVVLDNLVTGFKSAVLYGTFIEGDTADRDLVMKLMTDFNVDSVIHFAAHTIVPESVSDPLKYYRNNTSSSLNLIECAVRQGVKNFIFSSTAAVYGIPEGGAASEESPTNPINPYGTSKLMTEWLLRDVSVADAMNYVALRYFNVAGADPKGRIGQSTEKATLLTKVACQAAVGKRDHVSIFGTDYDTPDGTGLRDYIHVEDLASAHIKALDYLRNGGASVVLNCGYGHGYSVREVIATVEKANGMPLKIVEENRREGDPPVLIAVADKIKATLGWEPEYDDLDVIAETSLAWEKHLLEHPAA